ncbi:MAG: molybdopterin molybdotransferase MoeA [Eubacteriaceae bacterium]|nr:molybdopterin molybdotransferase MoeA [Eubacteriaceae bacterium]
MEFLNVDTIESAREKLLGCSEGWLVPTESVPIENACGRVASGDIYCRYDIPAFRRSTVDGYAVRSSDTAAAGESIPVILELIGSIDIGSSTGLNIKSGEAAAIPTGGMVPNGADSVVMVEYSEVFSESGVAIYASVSNGENVAQVGEDAKNGDIIVSRGKRLLPQDIGALASAGIVSIDVYKQPRIAIISTGDELVHPGETPKPGQIRDINTYSLTAQAQKIGYLPVMADVLKDDAAALEQSIRDAIGTCDIVAVSGGSSQGDKDITREIIDKASGNGVFTHGIAIKPGKPTILGYDKASNTLLCGLPGHPVSAMAVFELLFGWLLRELTGAAADRQIPAEASCNIASSPGRLTCQPAKLRWESNKYIAEPIFGKSGLITTLTQADGYFIIDRNKEGISKGQTVLVNLF